MQKRVKLRPDAHFAPVRKGVYWTRPGGRTFVLAGPATLFHLIDSRLDLLTTGTSVDELVDAVGDERARPVLDHVVRTLLAQEMLLDLDAAGPAPDAATAAEFADVLAYVEARCARPYEVFTRLRTVRVAVLGAGPAIDSLVRGLTSFGVPVTASDVAPGTAGLVVAVDDEENPLDLAAVAALRDHPPVLPLVARDGLAAVGPVVASGPEMRTFLCAATRFASWAQLDGVAPAPRPVGAVLAGALAARVALDHLIGVAGEPHATVVYGHAAETRRLRLGYQVGEPALRDVDGEGTGDIDGDPDTTLDTAGIEPDADQFHQRTAWLGAHWTGPVRWGDDLDLTQLPVALATLQDVDAAIDASVVRPAVLGWGTDRADAGVNALLSYLRARAGAEVSGGPGWVAAAGLTEDLWITDGLLRLAGAERLSAPPDRELSPQDAGSWTNRSLWSLVRDYFGEPVRLWLCTVPGVPWSLVTATGADGCRLRAQWGPTPAAAVRATITAVTAHLQARHDNAVAVPQEPVGTWHLQSTGAPDVARCRLALGTVAAGLGRRIVARQLVTDPVGGRLPLYCGLVGLR